MTSSSAERRGHARRLFEESDADPDWIAGAMGIGRASLDGLARREGWVPKGEDEDGLAHTIDRLVTQLSVQLRAFEARTANGEEMGKVELDALLAITRTFDRLAEMKRAEEARASGRPDERELNRARAVIERRVGEISEQRVETIIDRLRNQD